MLRKALRKLEALACRVLVARSEGQTNVEYSLILLLLGVGCAAVFKFLGAVLRETLTAVSLVFP